MIAKRDQLQFASTREESRLMGLCVDRIMTTGVGPQREVIDWHMDLTACHSNGCPMDFQKLLDAPMFDFLHDMVGIANHIDRSTGQLQHCFLPRCTAKVLS
jgi:hypothetical protein